MSATCAINRLTPSARTAPDATFSCSRSSSTASVCGTACTETRDLGSGRLHAPRERDAREHALERVVRRSRPSHPRRVVVAADRHPGQAGVGELLEPGEDVGEGSVRRTGVVEDVSQPEEPVGLLADRLLDRPRERAKEVFLPHVATLLVAQVREVRTPEVRVAERDEPRHLLGEPLRRVRGPGGSGEGRSPTSGSPRTGRSAPAGRTALRGWSRSPHPASASGSRDPGRRCPAWSCPAGCCGPSRRPGRG